MRTYSIENGIIAIEVLDLGAKLLSFKHHKDNINIVLKYEDFNLYQNDTGPYLNACIGPIAGRLDHARFGDIQLKPNADPHQLHGGEEGIHNKVFDVRVYGNELILTTSVDHRVDGYPAQIKYEIKYRLMKDTLILSMKAWPDVPQAINLTNHAYFNLDGSETVSDHVLMIKSDFVGSLADEYVNKGNYIEVDGTVFDYRGGTKLRNSFEGNHQQFSFTRNLDHFYPVNELELSVGNKHLNITTSAPGFQLYSANFFDETFKDEYGRLMKVHAGLAIEPQRPGNEINIDLETPIYSKEKPFEWVTKYQIDYNA